MVEVTIDYKGDLHCEAHHGPSNSTLATDAPVDNQGRGEAFSPTDLVATALGTCMATIMGITARRKELSLAGLQIKVAKEMSSDSPRRITRLAVTIAMPLPADHPEARLLINSALTCPVHQSIHPDIEVPIEWRWQ
ncbi:OsmC family protein [Roseibacillus ishigakijimensis]|uniref:OsmC family protein n=1 Tax=Roseibacillus ishigakijimensis TaxID=454146 RepID=A0A934RR50_9BACT|nr:OsmC family protein [Roseibacillus ishigakijimensis]